MFIHPITVRTFLNDKTLTVVDLCDSKDIAWSAYATMHRDNAYSLFGILLAKSEVLLGG